MLVLLRLNLRRHRVVRQGLGHRGSCTGGLSSRVLKIRLSGLSRTSSDVAGCRPGTSKISSRKLKFFHEDVDHCMVPFIWSHVFSHGTMTGLVAVARGASQRMAVTSCSTMTSMTWRA